jgi:hypothetical protein
MLSSMQARHPALQHAASLASHLHIGVEAEEDGANAVAGERKISAGVKDLRGNGRRKGGHEECCFALVF